MFRPQIQKTRVLVILAIINLSMVYIAHFYTYEDDAPGYIQKKEATKIMDDALKVLKNEIRPKYKPLKKKQLKNELTDRGIEYEDDVSKGNLIEFLEDDDDDPEIS